jgi:hypothetical protein
MAIAEYSQAEADWMIALEKIAKYEAEIYEVHSRYRPGYSSKAFEAETKIEQRPAVSFKVRTEANISVGAYCIVLEGSIGERPMEGLCRFDVHDTAHNNNCICCAPPPQIFPGQFHVHRYNECTINRGNNWDKCGSLLTVVDSEFKKQIRQLIGNFIDEMKLTFSDSDTVLSIFESGNP